MSPRVDLRSVAGCPHKRMGEEQPWSGTGCIMSTCLDCGTTITRPSRDVEGYEEGDMEAYEAGYVDNPPWSDNLIKKNRKEIEKSGLPMPAGTPVELGAGHYGAVYETDDPGVVFKITSDETEGAFIKRAKPLGWPYGIVQYEAIIDFEKQHRGRNTFGIWREAAFEVGLAPKSYGTLSYDDRNAIGFQKYLQHFKRAAALARDTIKKRPHLLEYAMSPQGKQWAWDNIELEMAEPDEKRYEIWSTRMADQPLSRFVGWKRIAGALQACSMLAEMMEHNNAMSNSVGAALTFYLDNGILLADVHSNNVGKVRRSDEWGDQELWVITDPGHAVFLD